MLRDISVRMGARDMIGPRALRGIAALWSGAIRQPPWYGLDRNTEKLELIYFSSCRVSTKVRIKT